MTAVLSVPTALPVPTTALSDPARPLSVQAGDYLDALAAGAVAVDIRPHSLRQAHGALFGAVAIDADDVLARLTPGSDDALRTATADARWILVGDDGNDAEWLAWHLQARGVLGAVFVVGGHRRLRALGVSGRISSGDLAMLAAHE